MASKDVSIDIVAQDRTGAAFKSVKGGLNDLSTSVGAVTGKIAGLTAVLAAIGSAAQVKGLIDSADNMNKLSQKTGIAVSELSSLANTADLAGVSNEQLGSALVKLNKSIAEAASGSKEQAEACTNLGINVKDANGNVAELHCSYIPESKSGSDTSGINVKGTLHWVSAAHAIPAEVRLYDRLFNVEDVAGAEGDFKDYINKESLTVVPHAYAEPALLKDSMGVGFQFLRKGYFCADKDSTPTKLVFNRTVGLKDTWAKEVKKGA